jgi:thioredoxin 1
MASSFRTYEESYTSSTEKENYEKITFNIESKEVFHEILKRYEIVFVDVWANFCAPCKMFSPMYDKLALEYKTNFENNQIIFLKDCIDDETIESIHGSNIKAVPTFFLYLHGKLVGTMLGVNIQKMTEVCNILLSIHSNDKLEKKEIMERRLENIYRQKLLEKNEELINDINDKNIGVC